MSACGSFGLLSWMAFANWPREVTAIISSPTTGRALDRDLELPPRTGGLAEPGHVQRDRARKGARLAHQPAPLVGRVRVAVDEHDRLGRVLGAGLEHAGANSVHGQRALAHR